MGWLADTLIMITTILTILTVISLISAAGRWVKRRIG